MNQPNTEGIALLRGIIAEVGSGVVLESVADVVDELADRDDEADRSVALQHMAAHLRALADELTALVDELTDG